MAEPINGLLVWTMCDALVLVGNQDPVTPPDCSWEIHEAVPDSRLMVVENCGHCAPLEYPALVNAQPDAWLAQHGPAQAPGVLRRGRVH